jgi:hypothetical protein
LIAWLQAPAATLELAGTNAKRSTGPAVTVKTCCAGAPTVLVPLKV